MATFGTLGSIGSAVGDFASAYNALNPPGAAAAQAALPYTRQGAQLLGLSSTLEGENTSIQQYAQGAQGRIQAATQQAAVASSGFGTGGTALALARQAAQQTALAQTVTGIQGQITQLGTQAQQQQMLGQAEAEEQEAKAGSSLGAIGGALGSAIGGIAQIASIF